MLGESSNFFILSSVHTLQVRIPEYSFIFLFSLAVVPMKSTRLALLLPVLHVAMLVFSVFFCSQLISELTLFNTGLYPVY